MKKASRFLIASLLLLSPVAQSCNPDPSSTIGIGNEYAVTLVFDDGVSRNHVIYVEQGESVTLPSDPQRDGYSFAGWKDEDGNIVTGSYTPSKNTTLTATWTIGTCTVTFHANYEGGEDVTREVDYGSYITEAPTINRPGFNLRHWSVLSDGDAVDFSTYQIRGDYSFYAIWRSEDISEYTVTVVAGDYEGAPVDTDIVVEQGESIRSSNRAFRITRSGYTLEGFTEVAPSDGRTWSIDDYDNISSLVPELISYPYTPTGNVTLYAVWSIQQYSIIWNYNYTDSPASNGVYSTDSILSNESVVPPETDPSRTDYDFIGWYQTALGDDPVDFSQGVKVTSNTGYYAHWKHKGVTTNIFQAEYVHFDPNKEYWGYSGSVRGQKCIVKDGGTVGEVYVDQYPLNSVLTQHNGYYVSYQYENGCTLRFEINSSKATTATLKGSFAVENMQISNIGSSGDYSTLITVNGTSITYSLNLSLVFQEYTIGQVQLNEGLNVIEIVVNNSNTILGGTYKAVGFNTDYIKLDDTDATLSWSPIYDNLEEV